ncbi:AraC family transcriptional regulator [Catalinimonas sp. 4WD22]|uniref:helix-turn-helix domain-containing protein n=1 Tax=Catalinimonas locisalis TaxID=3133978 RepID=UPI003100B72D
MLKAKKSWWHDCIKKIAKPVNTKQALLFDRNEDPRILKSKFDELSIWEDVLFQQRNKLNELYTNAAFPSVKKRDAVSGREPFVCKSERIMEAHITDVDFDVSSFSHEMGMSRVHLYRLMKYYTDQSPSEFIRNYRLHKATYLLLLGNETVSEVAYRTGFNDLSHFSKCFKKVFGVCPSEYKKVEIMSYLPV